MKKKILKPKAAAGAADAALKAFAKARGETQAKAQPNPSPKAQTKPHQDKESQESFVATPVPLPSSTSKSEPNVDGLNEQETTFIEILLTGNYTIDNAMKLAGYGGTSQRNRYHIASRIIQKYESGVGDARKIMRATGVGEVAVALKIKELMEDSSRTIQAKATELAGKYLGMTKETLEIEHGITIVIKGSDRAPATPGVPPDRPKAEEPKALPGPTPISIIK